MQKPMTCFDVAGPYGDPTRFSFAPRAKAKSKSESPANGLRIACGYTADRLRLMATE
jgi:hypothetical protein